MLLCSYDTAIMTNALKKHIVNIYSYIIYHIYIYTYIPSCVVRIMVCIYGYIYTFCIYIYIYYIDCVLFYCMLDHHIIIKNKTVSDG